MIKKEYQPLTIPKLSWEKKTLTEQFGELTAQPLEPGFGMTLGTALRRTLLGGVEGSAVTSVIIHGVNNEFSALPGVIEDTMQVVLNIKEIIIHNTTGLPGTMRLSIKGQAVATVADIQADAHLELLNKEHVLAHVSPAGALDIEFFVESGRGYRPAQWPADQALQKDNRIFVDAMFSPVRKVTFDVPKARVGRNIDHDKLVLSVQTDGTINPVEAVNYAVSVLRTQLEHFLIDAEIPFNTISEIPVEEVHEAPVAKQQSGLHGFSSELLLKPIDVLEFSVRAHNCLINAGIKRIVDLVNLSEDELQKIKNFGRKSFEEVKEGVRQAGFSFNMNIKESDLKKLQEKEAQS